MKKEISLNDFIREFEDCNRDYFSYEGYQALYDYYDEFEDFNLDVIAICSEVTEYDEDELFNDYGKEEDFKEFKEENKDIYDDEEEFKEEYIKELVEEMQNNTTVIKLDNGSYLVWEF